MNNNEDLRAAIRTIPDFPKPGILFRDVTTLFLDGPKFRAAINRLADRFSGDKLDAVAGIEARGFLVAAAVAYRLGTGVLIIRKHNKLPGETVGIDYALEYGQDRIEMHSDAVVPGANVLLVDDLVATGGTACAALDLLRGQKARVTAAGFIVDLPALGGAARLRKAGARVESLLSFED